MEKIKEQVSAIVAFASTDLDKLGVEYGKINDRINEGVQNMKAAGVFTEKEVNEIFNFGKELLNRRYNETKQIIAKQIRDNFKF